MNNYAYVSLGAYFLLMMAIGLYAYRKSSGSASDFLLGGRKLNPMVGALSAGASDMSGWMLMGLPGAIYVSGLSSAWIAVGLLIGAFANYVFVAPRLRVYTELANDSITIPDFFENRFEDKSHWLRGLSALVIIVFFTLYTSAGIVAGGKFFESSFDVSYAVGICITAGVVVAYTLFGGFLAVSLTDFVQGCIMLVALVLVPIVAMTSMGGLDNTLTVGKTANPDILDWFGTSSLLGIISAAAWGLGYFGQPHIIVRFMAIRSVDDIRTARHIGMGWMLVTLIGASATGLFGLAYMSQNNLELKDPETIFIVLSQLLFHPLIAGFLLAAILAAIMSTISSQLLVSSSSISKDVYRTFIKPDASQKELVFLSRCAIGVVSVFALLLAVDQDSSILSLVSNAWAGFGASFGPLILLSLFWKRMNTVGALSAMLAGSITVLFWIFGPVMLNDQPLSALIYEIVPGFIVSLIAGVVGSLMTQAPSSKITHQFDDAIAKTKA